MQTAADAAMKGNKGVKEGKTHVKTSAGHMFHWEGEGERRQPDAL